MHKLIKKYQTPNEGLSYMATPQVGVKINAGADMNAILNGFNKNISTGSTAIPTNMGAGLGAVGLDLLGQAPQLVDAGIQAFGGKKADNISGGEEFGMNLMDQGASMMLKSGNPALMGIGAGLTALTALNKYAGKTGKQQGTVGLDTGAYTFQSSSQAGKKQTLLGTWGGKVKQADNLTAKTDRMNLMGGNASYQNKQNLLSAQNTFGDIDAKNQQKLFGGINTNILSASKGTKINPAKLRNLSKKVKKKEFVNLDKPEETITKFEEGGKLNVIPDGALHARKHDLPEEIANQVTDKGIPVVTYDEGGEITQHAEIELNEIIFHKETTDILEDYFKKYKEASDKEKNELAIECGKFLTLEILENTQDNTGLLNEIE